MRKLRLAVVVLFAAVCMIGLAASGARAGTVHQAAKRVTWYHICMAQNHSLCEQAHGAGHNLSVESSGANKWQAIPDPDSGDIEWQNGSGNCMVSTSTGTVTIINGGCNDASSNQDWDVGGSGNLTFLNQAAACYMGTWGAQAGKLVYCRPMSSGFFAGWVTIFV